MRGVPVRWGEKEPQNCAHGRELASVSERVTDRALPLLFSWTLERFQSSQALTQQSVKRYVRQHPQQLEHPCLKRITHHLRPAEEVAMHPSSTSTSTPFSVKDILKLQHHHDFGNEFLTADQVVPMNHQHVHAASRSTDFYGCRPEPRVSGTKERLHAENTHSSAAAEEINEQGEMIHSAQHGHSSSFLYTDGCLRGVRPPDGTEPWAPGTRDETRPVTCHIFVFLYMSLCEGPSK